MIPERLARQARAAIEELAAAGALERTEHRAISFRRLSADARSIGLFDLATRLEAVAAALEAQAGRGPRPSVALAEALLASYDRIEALSARLARGALLSSFGAEDDDPEAP
ncbi:hypothetical protein [Polyangium jinanense]|uniref:Uncharacterized protein n=1 Tax=Polyangium jinanense TaxID=2829994 RepID=A0A9X4ASL3_9BACT|nr:hypothetical protein [Polyangium jinanense]MDC3957224.1 hypothetical protein [Polyangium jinanense]MDC3982626.1 hypothetical protein [Polyangium jinanense]